MGRCQPRGAGRTTEPPDVEISSAPEELDAERFDAQLDQLDQLEEMSVGPPWGFGRGRRRRMRFRGGMGRGYGRGRPR